MYSIAEKSVDKQTMNEHISTNNGTFIEKHLQAKSITIYIICNAVFILLENSGSIFIDIFRYIHKITANNIKISRNITIIATYSGIKSIR